MVAASTNFGLIHLVELLGSAGCTNAAGSLVIEMLWNLAGPGLESRRWCWIGWCGRWAAPLAVPCVREPSTC